MLTLTSPFDTWLHRVPAGLKLAALAVATALILPIRAPLPAFAVLGAVAALYLVLGRGFAAQGLRLLRPLWPFAVILLAWHGATGALAAGAALAAKMAAAVALANLVTLTTRLSAMMAVLERLAAPLRLVGLPPRHLALALALVIRFTPVLMARAGVLRDAWRARSAKGPLWRLTVPLALSALDDADHVAEALRARGGI